MSTEMPSSQIEISDIQKLRIQRGLIVFVALALVVVVSGILIRRKDAAALTEWAGAQTIPSVTVITPTVISNGRTVLLPGRLEAWEQAPIYARVSGYVKSWKVDIGVHVKAGQLLAEIDTPELDQQFEQAKADLVRAQANAALAGSTAKRWSNLLATDSVSRQEADEKEGDSASRQAAVLAAKANLDRLVALRSFKSITAPFDGVVTARQIDVGALIAGGNDHGPELFRIADTSKLRLYVDVPQNEAAWLHSGMPAELTVPERPQAIYQASLASTSEAVNRASGSILAQFVTSGQNGELLPGGYASVRIPLPANAGVVRIPASALIFKSEGTRVAVVRAGDRVELKDVHIAMDYGDMLDIDRGLNSSDRIIDSPPDSLIQGDQVQVMQASESSGAARNEKK